MDLQSGKFYWPTTIADIPEYPMLEEDIRCDVLIIGGGSSGAQCAQFLSDTDLDVVVVDKRKIGMGSTCTNTALLQMLGDKMLHHLVNSFGEKTAMRHIKLSEQAINEMEQISHSLDIDPEFMRRDTLYYASDQDGIEKLQKDYFYLAKHGFNVETLLKDQIKERYPFEKDFALYIYNDAEINPFKYNHGLLMDAHKKGVRVYEQTNVEWKSLQKGTRTLYTDNGHTISAHHIIVAAGYENLEVKNEKNTKLQSTYAVITNPVEDFTGWYNRTLIWETVRPYIYMRTTKDNRIIIGGLDNNEILADDRDSKIIYSKNKLIDDFNTLFPDIKVFPEYYLGGFFGNTHDGLPVIGQYEDYPDCYFLYAYSDIGLVYSHTLAKIIKDLITTGSHPDLKMYQQNRQNSSEKMR